MSTGLLIIQRIATESLKTMFRGSMEVQERSSNHDKDGLVDFNEHDDSLTKAILYLLVGRHYGHKALTANLFCSVCAFLAT